MTHVEKATELFYEKFNCSQAVLGAYAKDFGMSEEDAFRVALCLSGGMRKGEVCGAVSGALMVIGLKYGQASADGKAVSYEKATEFMDKFKKENGSYICKEILEYDISTADGMKNASEKNLFKTVCPKMVESAVKILEDMD